MAPSWFQFLECLCWDAVMVHPHTSCPISTQSPPLMWPIFMRSKHYFRGITFNGFLLNWFNFPSYMLSSTAPCFPPLDLPSSNSLLVADAQEKATTTWWTWSHQVTPCIRGELLTKSRSQNRIAEVISFRICWILKVQFKQVFVCVWEMMSFTPSARGVSFSEPDRLIDCCRQGASCP